MNDHADKKTEVLPQEMAPKKKKAARNIPLVIIHIHASLNNTLMTVTDLQGNAIAWSSAGQCGFKGPKKSTPYAATMLTKKIAEKIKEFGVKDAHVVLHGIGSGREAALRAIHGNAISILSIKDMTPIPHNGCRRPKERRI